MSGESNYSFKTLYKYFQGLAPIALFISLSALVVVDLSDPNKMYLYWELVSVIVVIASLPFLPYISTIRFRDTEVDITDAEWIEDKGKLRGGTTATAEGDEIQGGKRQYD